MPGIEVRKAAATALAVSSCAATPRQSAASASCSSFSITRIWSAVGFATIFPLRVPVAAAHSRLCPAFHDSALQQLSHSSYRTHS